MQRKLNKGMVGGGKDAFTGAVHRMAANLEGFCESYRNVCAGSFVIRLF